MAQVDPVHPSRALHRSLAHREDNAISLEERNYFGPGLHPGALLRHHELTPGKILLRLGEQDRDLQRENVLTVDILMQTVVVPRHVA